MDQAPIINETPAPQTPNASNQRPEREYPGTYDNMFADAKNVLLFDAMDGFRAEIMKQVTPFFTMTHSLMLGSQYFPREMGNSLYNLSIDVYRQRKNFNATLDSTGRVAGRFVWPINKQWNVICNALTSRMPGQDNFSAEVHYKGPDYHLSAKASSGSVLSATYSQYIMKNLTLGMEVTRNPIRAGLAYSIAGKYALGTDMFGCTLSSLKQMEMFYVNSPSKRTKLVSKLTIDFNNRMSEMQIGCLYLFKSGKLHMTLTSSGRLQTFIEEYVTPTLLMTISVDHSVFQNATRVGFGTKVMMG